MFCVITKEKSTRISNNAGWGAPTLKRKIFFACSALIICAGIMTAPACVYAEDTKSLYEQARIAAKTKDRHSAFMFYHAILDMDAASPYAQEALFGVGEYYYLIEDEADAIKAFTSFARQYPESPGFPFALVYLLKITQNRHDEQIVKDLENQIVTLRQLSLLFRDHQKLTYRSPLFRKHTLTYYIDKVECHIDGELIAQISY